MRNIRKRLKKYKFLRVPYNFISKELSYRKEWLKYKCELAVERINSRKEVKNILLIRTFGIGDIVRTTPAAEKLKRKHPGAKVDYFTYKSNAPILAGNPNIDKIFTELDIKEACSKQYDLVINWQIFDTCEYTKKLMKDIRAKRILGRHFNRDGVYNYDTVLRFKTWMEMFFRIALVPYNAKDPEKTNIYSCHENTATALDRFRINSKDRYVGICIGGNEVARPEYWYRNFSVEFLEKLIVELTKKHKVIMFGQSKDRNEADQKTLSEISNRFNIINLIDKLTLNELIIVLKRCACVISSDTGMLHMSIALKVPTVALFSNNTGSIYIAPKKRGRYYRILYNDKPRCFPCEQLFEKECLEKKRAQCIEGISVSKISREVEDCIGHSTFFTGF